MKTDFWRKTILRIVIITLCFALGLFLIWAYFAINNESNFRTAFIEKSLNKFIITIYGKRKLMAHDPISFFKKNTYTDSVKFDIPRDNGIIDGIEITNRPGSYKILQGKAIVIENKRMVINLFYDNYDDKKVDPSTWNGSYELAWRK